MAVLFVDLSGYTSLTTELGAEDTRALLDQFFAIVDSLAERHGGTIVQHVGDCALALFGAPVARGDDVRRSLRAALAMLDAMPELSAAVGREMRVHIGVTVGDVVAGDAGSEAHRAYAVTGDCVNLAARLSDLAGPGELLVSDSIRLAMGSAGKFEDRGEHRLQGIAGPVRVHRLLGLSEPEEVGSFVGRGTELAQLTMLLARTERSWQGAMALVRGEAGIGKTRLLRELQRRAEAAGVACHTAIVLDFGSGEGSDVVRVLTRKLLGVDGGDPEAREQVAFAAAAAGITDNRLGPFLLDLLDLPLAPNDRRIVDAMAEGDRRLARQDTFAAALACAAADQPLMLLVEDVHWAEPGTLEDLAAAATVIADLPVLLLMSTRREGDPIDAAWLARAAPVPATTVDLHPLRASDAMSLAGELLAGDDDDQAVERCVVRAQGNPLFLEQLLRHVREGDDDVLPATIQTLIQARIDRLAAGDREALSAASVLGQSFTLPALRAVLGEARFEPSQLVQRLLVRPTAEGYLFAHALIRDAVYDQLMRARRRELHARAAKFFAGQDAGLHAQHLDRAADPAAAGAYATAARQQADAFHDETALELATRGLEIAESSADRLALACLVGRLQLGLGRVEAAETAFAAALELAGDPAGRCRVLLGLAAAMRLSDRFDEALGYLDEAFPLVDDLGLADERSHIAHLRSDILSSIAEKGATVARRRRSRG
ncbi:MAG: adenylate/guanylate cyclase domain-containing protein [Geminicoccaceae bacterium]